MVDPNTLEVTAIIGWGSSGFYPAEFEAEMWLRCYQEPVPVPDDIATERLIRLLDHRTVTRPRVATIDSLNGTIHIWHVENRDRHYTLSHFTFMKGQMPSYEKKLGV